MQALEGCRHRINLIDFIQSKSNYINLERFTDKLTDIQYFPLLFDLAQPYLKKTLDHKHLDGLPKLCGELRDSTRLTPLACVTTGPGRVEAAGRAVDKVVEGYGLIASSDTLMFSSDIFCNYTSFVCRCLLRQASYARETELLQ